MIFKQNRCPECGEYAAKIEETTVQDSAIQWSAGGDGFEYEGDLNDGDSYPEATKDARNQVTLKCLDGHEWKTWFSDESEPPAKPTRDPLAQRAAEFLAECEETEYTDTGVALEILGELAACSSLGTKDRVPAFPGSWPDPNALGDSAYRALWDYADELRASHDAGVYAGDESGDFAEHLPECLAQLRGWIDAMLSGDHHNAEGGKAKPTPSGDPYALHFFSGRFHGDDEGFGMVDIGPSTSEPHRIAWESNHPDGDYDAAHQRDPSEETPIPSSSDFLYGDMETKIPSGEIFHAENGTKYRVIIEPVGGDA